MMPTTDNKAFNLFASVHPEKSDCTTSTCNFDHKPMQHPTIDDNDADTTAVMDSTPQRHQKPPPVTTDTTKKNPSKPQLPISLENNHSNCTTAMHTTMRTPTTPMMAMAQQLNETDKTLAPIVLPSPRSHDNDTTTLTPYLIDLPQISKLTNTLTQTQQPTSAMSPRKPKHWIYVEFMLTFQAANCLDAAIAALSAALDALVAKVASQPSLPTKAENHMITITTDYGPATPPPDPTAPDPSFSPNPNQIPPLPPPPPDPDPTTYTDTTPRKKPSQKPKTHPAQPSQ